MNPQAPHRKNTLLDKFSDDGQGGLVAPETIGRCRVFANWRFGLVKKEIADRAHSPPGKRTAHGWTSDRRAGPAQGEPPARATILGALTAAGSLLRGDQDS